MIETRFNQTHEITFNQDLESRYNDLRVIISMIHKYLLLHPESYRYTSRFCIQSIKVNELVRHSNDTNEEMVKFAEIVFMLTYLSPRKAYYLEKISEMNNDLMFYYLVMIEIYFKQPEIAPLGNISSDSEEEEQNIVNKSDLNVKLTEIIEEDDIEMEEAHQKIFSGIKHETTPSKKRHRRHHTDIPKNHPIYVQDDMENIVKDGCNKDSNASNLNGCNNTEEGLQINLSTRSLKLSASANKRTRTQSVTALSSNVANSELLSLKYANGSETNKINEMLITRKNEEFLKRSLYINKGSGFILKSSNISKEDNITESICLTKGKVKNESAKAHLNTTNINSSKPTIKIGEQAIKNKTTSQKPKLVIKSDKPILKKGSATTNFKLLKNSKSEPRIQIESSSLKPLLRERPIVHLAETLYEDDNGGFVFTPRKRVSVQQLSSKNLELLESEGILKFTYDLTNEKSYLEAVIEKLQEDNCKLKEQVSTLKKDLTENDFKLQEARHQLEIYAENDKKSIYNEEGYNEIDRLLHLVNVKERELNDLAMMIRKMEVDHIEEKRGLEIEIIELYKKCSDLEQVKIENSTLKNSSRLNTSIKLKAEEFDSLMLKYEVFKTENENLKRDKQKILRKLEKSATEIVIKDEKIKEREKENFLRKTIIIELEGKIKEMLEKENSMSMSTINSSYTMLKNLNETPKNCGTKQRYVNDDSENLRKSYRLSVVDPENPNSEINSAQTNGKYESKGLKVAEFNIDTIEIPSTSPGRSNYLVYPTRLHERNTKISDIDLLKEKATPRENLYKMSNQLVMNSDHESDKQMSYINEFRAELDELEIMLALSDRSIEALLQFTTLIFDEVIQMCSPKNCLVSKSSYQMLNDKLKEIEKSAVSNEDSLTLEIRRLKTENKALLTSLCSIKLKY